MFNKRALLYTAGIFSTYFYYGIVVEKMTKSPYPVKMVDPVTSEVFEENERFTYMLAFCGLLFFINYLFAKSLVRYFPTTDAVDNTRTSYYMILSLTYLLAMVASNKALQFVNYPTQVVAKAAKPIPVLLLGVLVGNKSYPLKKYIFVFLIVVGVSMFMYKDQSNHSNTNNAVKTQFGYGELLLGLSLLMDGIIGGIQERIRAESAPTAQKMMVNMNFWSSIFAAILLIVVGEGFKFVTFITRHPSVLFYMSIAAVCNALGQLFILYMVTDFGPLPCSIVTTTRKFFTVLFSVLVFGNTLTSRQWIGAAVVFVTLFLDSLFGAKNVHK